MKSLRETLLNRLQEQLSAEQQRTLELHFFEGYSPSRDCGEDESDAREHLLSIISERAGHSGAHFSWIGEEVAVGSTPAGPRLCGPFGD